MVAWVRMSLHWILGNHHLQLNILDDACVNVAYNVKILSIVKVRMCTPQYPVHSCLLHAMS